MAPSDLSSTENLSASEVQSSTEVFDDLAAQVPQPSLEGSMLQSETFAPKEVNWRSPNKKNASLAKRLLTVVLPTALIPLIGVGTLEYFSVKERTTADILEKVRFESAIAAETGHNFVGETLNKASVVGLNPGLRQALIAGIAQAEEDNLPQTEIDEVEQAFATTKLLNPNAELNQYLKSITETAGLGELFVTERNGFNVAYSNPTSDFVQRDEGWWQTAQQQDSFIGTEIEDESAGASGVEMAQAIYNPASGDFLGVLKLLVSLDDLQAQIDDLLSSSLLETQVIEILDTATNTPVITLTAPGAEEQAQALKNDEIINTIARELSLATQKLDYPVEQTIQDIRTSTGLADLAITMTRATEAHGDEYIEASFKLGERDYSMSTVAFTEWVAIAAIDDVIVQTAGNKIIRSFSFTALVLGVLASAVLVVLSRQLSAPLRSLTQTAASATDGQLDVRAAVSGTMETQTLGAGFNTLLDRLQSLLTEQTEAAAAQARQRQALEDEIAELMEDVGDAADGDLRVRAKLSDGDVGIVADLFNSIIENLRITTQQVKSATGKVSTSLLENEATVLDLSAQAVEEAESLKDTMEAVEDISKSIDEVAANANQASALTKDTYATVQAGTQSMDQTVTSILGLRSTVGETAKKIKRLGESAQKISQAVSLIDEIALKTNLLAVNASVEAARAGEMGQGFTAVAEQVGSLAEQSAAATKEIALIVSGIQAETQEVVEAIETGTAQVVDSTSLVEATKQQLADVLAKSEQINQLMSQISASAQYQTESSAAVTSLVKDAAEGSAKRSMSSQAMAKSIQETAQVAQALEASVEKFKLED